MNPAEASSRTSSSNPSVAAVAANHGVSADPVRSTRAGRIKLVLLFLAFASPVIASYLTYYVFPPSGRTNYGELIEPQQPVGETQLTQNGQDSAFALTQLRGKWVMLVVYADRDEASLKGRLYAMRQVRLTTGKDMDRIERVLVLLEVDAPAADLLEQHQGMRVLKTTREQWQSRWGQPLDRILMVDPLGNLMMRFPALADPNKMKKDLSRLLRASRMG